MQILEHLVHYILHIDSYLITFVTTYGAWTYFVLFLIIFCETGLIIMPFLPGDSLLFAAGSICAGISQPLSYTFLLFLLILASILGNKLNFLLGRALGTKLLSTQSRWFFNQRYLMEAQEFYVKHGGKTIILARFLPIIRTFAPFVAGMSHMNLKRFAIYNAFSAALWIGSLLSAGYFLGRLPFIQSHFSIVIYGIIAITLLPPLIGLITRKTITIKR